jgi:hypothetical protein
MSTLSSINSYNLMLETMEREEPAANPPPLLSVAVVAASQLLVLAPTGSSLHSPGPWTCIPPCVFVYVLICEATSPYSDGCLVL